MAKQKNILGEEIELCCDNPITGFFRDNDWRNVQKIWYELDKLMAHSHIR